MVQRQVQRQKILISPNGYVQGSGVLKRIGEQVKKLGDKGLAIVDKALLSVVEGDVEKSCQENNISISFEIFHGECSLEEINRLQDVGKNFAANMILGVGGGKTIDTAKAVAYYMGLPVVVVPTAASTDAPCSALSVIYTEEGVFDKYLFLPKNPDLVLVDTAIVAKAPVRLLVSGMGDALATWFEADACKKAWAQNFPKGFATETALNLARLCYDILLDYGLRAKLAVENGVVTEDVEKVVEANTLLSGLGFESGGIAAAHAIHNGFTALEETHEYYHGEKVAFGTLVQLIMENRSNEELEEVLDFCTSIGLPVTLRQIGVKKLDPEKIGKVAKLACKKGETIYNMPMPVDEEVVYNAILAANAIGEEYIK